LTRRRRFCGWSKEEEDEEEEEERRRRRRRRRELFARRINVQGDMSKYVHDCIKY
jgi:hypothetical protein